MFGISYDTWNSVCNMYFSMNVNSQKAYLQLFPFTKLTSADKELISGEDFFNRYIKTASFMLFPSAMHQSENYMQKGDGSFRDSSLVSPVLFLFLQAIGMEIYKKYTPVKHSDISTYYAGNYEYLRPKYKQDYDNFFKELNSCIDEYQYFIKTDIANFFSNINLDKLIAQIDAVCNNSDVVFTQTQLHLFKEVLSYCGNGRFPLIENSVATSFLATVVYLDVIDSTLHKYISTNVTAFSSFRIIRYVDDMYILISSDKPIGYLHEAYNEIRNEYSSILKEFGLALNTKKCCLKESKEINQELKKSLYDECFNGEKHNIEELFAGALYRFLDDLSIELLLDSIDIETYNNLINKHFSSDGIEFTPSEVFNYFIYENDKELQTETVINEIVGIVEQSVSFINLDPKRLTVMIMKTKSEKAIKAFLNQLFTRHKLNKWNSYDTTVAISYLIQSKFRHIDLLDVLSVRHRNLYSYYCHHCKDSTVHCFNLPRVQKMSSIISQDNKANYLYFMYLCEKKRGNHMAAFAYYKNFFDRVTADIAFEINAEERGKAPNYKAYYKEGPLVRFYSSVDGSESVIKQAHDLRNSNPLSHSSSNLLDSNNTSEDLRQSISALSSLLYQYIDILEDQASSDI